MRELSIGDLKIKVPIIQGGETSGKMSLQMFKNL